MTSATHEARHAKLAHAMRTYPDIGKVIDLFVEELGLDEHFLDASVPYVDEAMLRCFIAVASSALRVPFSLAACALLREPSTRLVHGSMRVDRLTPTGPESYGVLVVYLERERAGALGLSSETAGAPLVMARLATLPAQTAFCRGGSG
ncbi:MAG: hypothetical protein FJ096_15855 [Deltaproteobacteria bacterium]|nr:hypothetical protein [Deltaproteobacteria bacterium]